jgi:hypothetical protein
VKDGEEIEDAVTRCMALDTLKPETIWAAYDRRFREMQLIAVYAAEVKSANVRLRPEEHSEYGWHRLAECLDLVHYHGLKEGLQSVHEYVIGADSVA